MNENEIKLKIIVVAIVIVLAAVVFVFMHFRARWLELKEAKRVIDSVVPVDAVVIEEEKSFFDTESTSSHKESTNIQKAFITIGVLAVVVVIANIIVRNNSRK